MPNQHPEFCQAIHDRKALTRDIWKAIEPGQATVNPDGSEQDLLKAFSVLQGIVNEYKDGGDQMTETCTCGQHEEWSVERG